MKVEIIKITPTVAAEMLEGNTNNRVISDPHVRYLTSEMKCGQWIDNGDPIRFNGATLLDGQHRLHAVIRSGVSISAVVIRGLSSEAFKTIDVGARNRTMGQVLQLDGEVNTTILGGAIRIVVDMRGDQAWKRSAVMLPPQFFFDFLKNEPGIRDSVHFIVGLKYLKKIAGPTIAAGLHYLFSQIDEAKAKEFMEDLDTGLVHDRFDPVYVLRQRLIENQSKRTKMERAMMLAFFVKAWNARFNGAQMKFLRWFDTESFPEIAGESELD